MIGNPFWISYCIVEIDHAPMDYTGVHEVGHVIGGHHDDDPFTSTDMGKVISAIVDYGTVMVSGSAVSPGRVLPYFSNPDVYVFLLTSCQLGGNCYYSRYSTGTPFSRDVAKTVQDRACEVSEFSDQLSILSDIRPNESLDPVAVGELASLVIKNPVRESITLPAGAAGASIHSTTGYFQSFQDLGSQNRLDISSLNPGTYYIRFQINDEFHIRKIVKL